MKEKLFGSDELDDSRRAEEASELCSILNHFNTERTARPVPYWTIVRIKYGTEKTGLGNRCKIDGELVFLDNQMMFFAKLN